MKFVHVVTIIVILLFVSMSARKKRTDTKDQKSPQPLYYPTVSPEVKPSIQDTNELEEYSVYTVLCMQQYVNTLADKFNNKLIYGIPVLLGYFKLLFHLNHRCWSSTSCSVDITSTSTSTSLSTTTLSELVTSTFSSSTSTTTTISTTTTSYTTPTTTLSSILTISSSLTLTMSTATSGTSIVSAIVTSTQFYTDTIIIGRVTEYLETITSYMFVPAGRKRRDLELEQSNIEQTMMPLL